MCRTRSGLAPGSRASIRGHFQDDPAPEDRPLLPRVRLRPRRPPDPSVSGVRAAVHPGRSIHVRDPRGADTNRAQVPDPGRPIRDRHTDSRSFVRALDRRHACEFRVCLGTGGITMAAHPASDVHSQRRLPIRVTPDRRANVEIVPLEAHRLRPAIAHRSTLSPLASSTVLFGIRHQQASDGSIGRRSRASAAIHASSKPLRRDLSGDGHRERPRRRKIPRAGNDGYTNRIRLVSRRVLSLRQH